MNAEQMLAAVMDLPDPDLMLATRIEDGPGDGAAYKASTVVRLIEQARAEERQRLLASLNQRLAGTVMSKYISLRECQAARQALEAAIELLRDDAKAAEQPAEPANSRARFDAFRAALDELCIKHGIQLSVSQYDCLQAWPLLPGEDPVRSCGFENCIPDDGGPK